jgi:hypothetical protein
MVSLRIAQAQYEHPVLTSVAIAVAQVPFTSVLAWLMSISVDFYIVYALAMTLALTVSGIQDMGKARKIFPPELWRSRGHRGLLPG